MASRVLQPTLRAISSPAPSLRIARSFQTSSRRAAEVATPLPVRKPVGAFRGGLFGFLLGSTLTGASVYYYVLDEYKISNELLQEDIFALQSTTQKVFARVQTLEEEIAKFQKK